MKRKPNGAGTLYREATRSRGTRWVSEAYVNLPDGRRVRVKGRGRDPEAAVLARLEAERRRLEEHPDARALTVKQLSEQWVAARSSSWKSETRRSYDAALRLHILPVIGAARVALVGSLDVQRVVNSVMRKEGSGASVANRCRRVMHALFAQAKRWGLIRDNPAAGVEPVRADVAPREVWTRAQARAFLIAASRSPYRDLFHAAITTGLRSGELLALRWGDVTERGFEVRRTYSQSAPGRVQSSPKSSAGYRAVPIPAELRERLEARRGDAAALVFPSRSGAVLNPVNVRRALRLYAERAEVPVVRFHALRRTYASLLAEAGYHPSVIQRHLGHSTPDLALRVYTSVTDSVAANAVVEIGGDFGSSRVAPECPSAAGDGPVLVASVALDTVN